jgi:hypothetical protein
MSTFYCFLLLKQKTLGEWKSPYDILVTLVLTRVFMYNLYRCSCNYYTSLSIAALNLLQLFISDQKNTFWNEPPVSFQALHDPLPISSLNTVLINSSTVLHSISNGQKYL